MYRPKQLSLHFDHFTMLKSELDNKQWLLNSWRNIFTYIVESIVEA